nr:hypothetical protein Iba_chr10fCG6660 [Ipomoea batatas]
MQPYEEENMEDMKNKMLARIEELKQEMANIREGWKQETQASIRTLEDQMAQVAKYMTSENNCIIEDVDNACVGMPSDEIGVKEHDNFCDEPYDDSFDHNCGDAYIENGVGNVDCVVDNVHANPLENVDDKDGLESFTFGDESLSNEHVDDLHEMLCGDDEMNVDARLHELNDVEIVTFLDNCLDDALYIHELIGEDKEETGGVWGCEGDALLYFV